MTRWLEGLTDRGQKRCQFTGGFLGLFWIEAQRRNQVRNERHWAWKVRPPTFPERPQIEGPSVCATAMGPLKGLWGRGSRLDRGCEQKCQEHGKESPCDGEETRWPRRGKAETSCGWHRGRRWQEVGAQKGVLM